MDQAILQTLLPNRPIRYFASTDSTMTQAKRWLSEPLYLPSGALVVADEQLAGRGRLGRTWLTPPASALAISLILRGAYKPMDFTMAGALAVAEAIEPFAAGQVGIKWPNDVLIDGKKVSGILTEGLWEGEALSVAIVGIGVNLTVDFAGTPVEATATSLHHHTALPIDRGVLLATIVTGVERWIQAENRFATWQARLVTLGQAVTVSDGAGQRYSGMAKAVQPDGALLVTLPDGNEKPFWAGEVENQRQI